MGLLGLAYSLAYCGYITKIEESQVVVVALVVGVGVGASLGRLELHSYSVKHVHFQIVSLHPFAGDNVLSGHIIPISGSI